jgi:hypothetical protein
LGLVIYVPLSRALFRFSILHLHDFAICLGAAILSIVWFEVFKLWKTQTPYKEVRAAQPLCQVKGGAYVSTSDVSWLERNPDSFPLDTVFCRSGICPIGGIHQKGNAASFLNLHAVAYVFGTMSTFATFQAGEAAATERFSKEAVAIVEQHRELAGLTRSSFSLATLLFGLTLAICTFLRLRVRELTGVLPVGGAIFYILGLYWLIHAAYQGERLVHEFGVGTF